MVMALAGPMPLYAVSSRMDIFPRVLRLLEQSFIILFMRATALSSVEPEPMSMASSSALERHSAPKACSFSLGRSSSAHSFIDSLLICRKYF